MLQALEAGDAALAVFTERGLTAFVEQETRNRAGSEAALDRLRGRGE